MPLQSTNMYAGGPIKAADVIQFFNLLTGSMTDQPVTLANTLTVGGSQSDASVPFRVSSQATGTARVMEVRTLQADVNPVFGVSRLGVLSFGTGGGTATDVTLSRSGANQLTITGLAGTPALVIPVGGLQVTAGNAGIGVAPSAVISLLLSASQTASAGAAYQVGIDGPLIAAANNDTLIGIRNAPAFNAASKSGVNAIGMYIPAVAPSNWGQATTSGYGAQIVAPTGAAVDNINLYLVGTPSGGTRNLSLLTAAGVQITAGNVGIGAAPLANAGIQITGAILSGSSGQQSIYANGTGSSAATTEISGVVSQPATVAAAFTSSTVAGFHALNPIKGAGSSITSAYGLVVDPITVGNVNNYGVVINTPSGGSGANFSLVASGDVFAGGVVNGANTTIATTGFLWIPNCAGTPTGVPTGGTGLTPGHTAIEYDTTANKLWIYNGAWRGVVVA